MPIYEYKCKKCGKDFEMLVTSSSDPLACPDCKGKVERKLSVFAASVASNACPSESNCPSAGKKGCGHGKGGGCACGFH